MLEKLRSDLNLEQVKSTQEFKLYEDVQALKGFLGSVLEAFFNQTQIDFKLPSLVLFQKQTTSEILEIEILVREGEPGSTAPGLYLQVGNMTATFFSMEIGLEDNWQESLDYFFNFILT